MQVCTRSTPGAAEQADLITGFKFLPLFNKDFVEVPIAGLDPGALRGEHLRHLPLRQRTHQAVWRGSRH